MILRHTHHTSVNGFSLIELSVVLAILALIMGSVILLMNRQLETNTYDTTADTINIIEAALQREAMISGYLPCPAPLDAALSTATYGVATDCAIAAAPSGTIDISAIAGTADDVRIGTIPTRSLNLPDRVMMDAWNMRLTYAVVKDLAVNKAMFNAYVKPASGGLTVTDSAGNTLIAATPVGGLVAYVVVSHGEDRKGATIINGASALACTPGSVDSENCDADTTFVDTSVNDKGVATAAFFDDLVIWKPLNLINPNLKW